MPRFLPNLSSDQTSLTVAIAAGIGVATVAGIVYFYRKYRSGIPPTEWRRVGELSDIICYPIKSCGPIKLNSIPCSQLGLEIGHLRDRIFMVIRTNGQFITARQYPKMTLIQPHIEENEMKVSAPGMINIEVDIDRLYKVPPIKCVVWGQTVEAIDCGEEVARWFSRFILSEDFGLRLVFYPGKMPTRDVRENNKIFDTMLPKDTGAFHDASSFMIFNESSLNDLNTRIDEPVQVLNFRPNFVVKGPLPYEENDWKWVKIGDDVVFRNIKPCSRCTFTNINPDNGTISADGNPLKALNEYRRFKKTGASPVLGAHLGVRAPGTVSIGDVVYAEAN